MADEIQDQETLDGNLQVAVAAEPQEEEFYDVELARYEAVLDRSLDEALERYGFTLFHSLPGLRQVELRQKLGFPVRDAIDNFNLAALAISREDYKGAAQLLEKALKENPDLADAHHNLALCCEKLDRKNDALKHWEAYLEKAESEEERQAVQAQISELKA